MNPNTCGGQVTFPQVSRMLLLKRSTLTFDLLTVETILRYGTASPAAC